MRTARAADLALKATNGRFLLCAAVFAIIAACGGAGNDGYEIPVGDREFTTDPGAIGYVKDIELTLDIDAPRTADIWVYLSRSDLSFAVPVVQTTEAKGRNVRVTLADDADADSYRTLGSAESDTFGGARLRPYKPLAFLRGERAEGEWTIRVANFDRDQTAVLRDWSLNITTTDQPPEPRLSVSTIYDLWQAPPADVGQEYCFEYRPPAGHEGIVEAEMLGPEVVDSNYTDFPAADGVPTRRGCVFFSLRPGAVAPELTLRVEAGAVVSTQSYRPTFAEPPAENVLLAEHFRSDELGFPGYRPQAVESWTDKPTGRSFVLAWHNTGTSFVEVTAKPRVAASLEAVAPVTTRNTRAAPAIAVNGNVAYVAHAGGMQVIDLTRLLDLAPGPPTKLSADSVVGDFDSARAFSFTAARGRLYLFAAGTCRDVDRASCKRFMMFDVSEPMEPALVSAAPDAQDTFNTVVSDSVCDVFPDASVGWAERCILVARPLSYGNGGLAFYDVTDPTAPVGIDTQAVLGPLSARWLDRVGDDLVVMGSPLAPGAPSTVSLARNVDENFWFEEFEAVREETSWWGLRVFPYERYLFIARFAGGVSVYDWRPGRRLSGESLEEVALYDMFPGDNFDDAGTDRFAGALDLRFFEETGRIAVVDPARGLFILQLSDGF